MNGNTAFSQLDDSNRKCPQKDQHQPDVLILNIHIPGKDGLGVIRKIKKEKLPKQVVLLTAVFDEGELFKAARFGVQGIVLKEMAPQMLLRCIYKVHAGEQWIRAALRQTDARKNAAA